MMLDGAGDDVLALPILQRTADGPVITFAAASRKINLTGFTVQRGSNLLARILECTASITAKGMNGAGIAVELRKIRHHGFQHLRTGSRGCRIIHINPTFTH